MAEKYEEFYYINKYKWTDEELKEKVEKFHTIINDYGYYRVLKKYFENGVKFDPPKIKKGIVKFIEEVLKEAEKIDPEDEWGLMRLPKPYYLITPEEMDEFLEFFFYICEILILALQYYAVRPLLLKEPPKMSDFTINSFYDLRRDQCSGLFSYYGFETDSVKQYPGLHDPAPFIDFLKKQNFLARHLTVHLINFKIYHVDPNYSPSPRDSSDGSDTWEKYLLSIPDRSLCDDPLSFGALISHGSLLCVTFTSSSFQSRDHAHLLNLPFTPKIRKHICYYHRKWTTWVAPTFYVYSLPDDVVPSPGSPEYEPELHDYLDPVGYCQSILERRHISLCSKFNFRDILSNIFQRSSSPHIPVLDFIEAFLSCAYETPIADEYYQFFSPFSVPAPPLDEIRVYDFWSFPRGREILLSSKFYIDSLDVFFFLFHFILDGCLDVPDFSHLSLVPERWFSEDE
ncbi:MAG: hypothetical protein ACTSPV_16525 [Candidatus Hodarchaeales archaeon]